MAAGRFCLFCAMDITSFENIGRSVPISKYFKHGDGLGFF